MRTFLLTAVCALAGVLLVCAISGTEQAPPALWRIIFGAQAGAIVGFVSSLREVA